MLGLRTGLVALTALVVVGLYFVLTEEEQPPASAGALPTGGGEYGLSLRGGDAVIWAAGDGADGGEDGLAVAEMIDGRRVDRFLYLGDVYEDGDADDFAEDYDPLFGRFAGVTAPTIGDHEWDNRAVGYEPYWEAVHGRPPPQWYAFSVAGWRLVSLSSEADHAAASPQLVWLRRELRTTRRFGNCRIAFWHRPRFTEGGHSDYPDIAPLWRAVRGKALLVLNGNDHNMQRFRHRAGTIELISGAGGRDLYEIDADATRLRFSNDTSHGALRLRLSGNRARLAYITALGTVLHRDSVACRRGRAP